MCPIMFVSQLYNCLYLYRNNYYTRYDDYNRYCYYEISDVLNETPTIDSIFIAKGNQGENIFVVPDEINGTAVSLHNIALRKSNYDIVLRNIKDDITFSISSEVPTSTQQIQNNTTIINNLTAIEYIRDFSVAYLNVFNFNLNFESIGGVSFYGTTAYNVNNKIFNLNVNNKVERVSLSGMLDVSTINVNYEGNIFTITTANTTNLGKISLNNNIKEFFICTDYTPQQAIEEIKINGITKDVKIDGEYFIDKINIAETNDDITIWLNDNSKVGEILTKNNVRQLTIKRAPLSSGLEEVDLVKVGRNIEKLTIENGFSGDLIKTIYYEGSEQEWNLINKDIPAGITVLFNQTI